jgi:hypothetical protein
MPWTPTPAPNAPFLTLVNTWALQAAERLGQRFLIGMSPDLLGAACVASGRIRETLHHHAVGPDRVHQLHRQRFAQQRRACPHAVTVSHF